jgi:hypothetical protein
LVGYPLDNSGYPFFGGYSVFELGEKMDRDIRILEIFLSNGG